MKKRVVALSVLLFCLGACSIQPSSNPIQGEGSSVQASDPRTARKLVALTDDYIEETLPRAPLNAMFFGDNRYNHLWPNNLSDEFIEEDKRITQRYLYRLARIDRSKLFGQDRFTYDIFALNLQNALEATQFPSHLLPLNQFIFSPHNLMIQLGAGLSAQPLSTVQDFDNFIQRMRSFVAWIGQAKQNMRKGMESGVTLPKTVVEAMIPQLQAQVLPSAEQSSLLGPLNSVWDKLPEKEYIRLYRIYTKVIAEEFMPAYADMAAFLEQEYLPQARLSDGLVGLPNGSDWYQFLIKTHTTSNDSAEQIHQMGLEEVARIHDEMRSIAQQVGFEGDLSAFLMHLKSAPQFYFSSPQQVLAAYEQVRSRVTPQLPNLFDNLPAEDYELRPYPLSQAHTAPGASYVPASEDGSRPGILFANIFNLKGQPKYGVESLSLREAVPGRHLQNGLQASIRALPRIRTQNVFTVYTEGWASYAESLGKELGLFTEPYHYFGRLEAELFNAMRLVVDTGLHAKGWTREQAIRYMRDHSAMTEAQIVSEVERYMVMPGQALAYKMGERHIRALRTFAERTLGEKFDVKAFHNQILSDGPLPMPLLEQKIQKWVTGSR